MSSIRKLYFPTLKILQFVIVLELIASINSSPVPLPVEKVKLIKPENKINLQTDRQNGIKTNDDIMKGMDAFFETYGPSFRKLKETGGLIPNPGNKFGQNNFINRNTEDKETTKKKSSKGHKRKSRKSHRHEGHHTRKHIVKVPQRETFGFGDPPSGLMKDDRKSAEEFDDSIESQKEAFESLLNYNMKHRKRPKELNDQGYMQLKYDYKTRKYTITENSDE